MMAEFCKDCFPKIVLGIKDLSKVKPRLSSKNDFAICEGCGKHDRYVLSYRIRWGWFI